jgi:hypothetical protein
MTVAALPRRLMFATRASSALQRPAREQEARVDVKG